MHNDFTHFSTTTNESRMHPTHNITQTIAMIQGVSSGSEIKKKVR